MGGLPSPRTKELIDPGSNETETPVEVPKSNNCDSQGPKIVQSVSFIGICIPLDPKNPWKNAGFLEPQIMGHNLKKMTRKRGGIAWYPLFCASKCGESDPT